MARRAPRAPDHGSRRAARPGPAPRRGCPEMAAVIGDTGATAAPASAATRLLLVRHAEVDNARRVLYGRLPRFALSAAGRREAERLAEALGREPVAALYSSPLLRARQTAGVIARHHPDAARHVSALLHEVRSAWEGAPLASFAAGFSTYGDRRA